MVEIQIDLGVGFEGDLGAEISHAERSGIGEVLVKFRVDVNENLK